jgi:hypothetical protein
VLVLVPADGRPPEDHGGSQCELDLDQADRKLSFLVNAPKPAGLLPALIFAGFSQVLAGV